MKLEEIRVEPAIAKEGVLAKVYVWEIPVRVTHWVNALAILVLSVTGIYIGTPLLHVAGPAGERFVMGWMKLVHFYAAIAFGLSVLSRILWMFVGNKYASWDKFLPVRKIRRAGIVPTLKYYTFLLRTPPGFVGHNPLAGLTYTVVFLLFLVQIGTGLAIYSQSAHVDSPFQAFGILLGLFGGLQTAHWIHHVVMWLLLGFMVHHVYSAALMSEVEANATMESIFSGFKFVPHDDLVYSGYRFIDRKTFNGG